MALLHTFTGKKLEPLYNPEQAFAQAVKLDVSLSLVKGTVLAEKSGTNEISKLTITGGPTGGTFTMSYAAQTTAAIPYNASPAEVQSALEALSTIGAGNVRCYGGDLPGGSIYIEWVGDLGATNITPPTTTDSLTGGSSPATVVATSQAGAAGSAGTFVAYSATGTNGSQVPMGILMYDSYSDASGNIVLGQTTSPEHGDTVQGTPMYITGIFKKSDLTGFNEGIRAALANRGIFVR